MSNRADDSEDSSTQDNASNDDGLTVIIFHQRKHQNINKALKTCLNKNVTNILICSPHLTDSAFQKQHCQPMLSHATSIEFDARLTSLTISTYDLIKTLRGKGKKVKVVTTLNYEKQIYTDLFIELEANTFISDNDINKMIQRARDNNFSRGSYLPKINIGYKTKSIYDFMVVFLLSFQWFRSFFTRNKSYIFNNNNDYIGGGGGGGYNDNSSNDDGNFENIITRVYIYKKIPINRKQRYTWSSNPKVDYDLMLSNDSKSFYGHNINVTIDKMINVKIPSSSSSIDQSQQQQQQQRQQKDNGLFLFKRLYRKMQFSIFTFIALVLWTGMYSASLIRFVMIVANPEMDPSWSVTFAIYVVTTLKISSFIRNTFIYNTSIGRTPKLSELTRQQPSKVKKRGGYGINLWFMIILHPLLTIVFSIMFLGYALYDYIINDD